MLPDANDPSAAHECVDQVGCVSGGRLIREYNPSSPCFPLDGAGQVGGTGDLITPIKGARTSTTVWFVWTTNFSSTHSAFRALLCGLTAIPLAVLGTLPVTYVPVPVGHAGRKSVHSCDIDSKSLGGGAAQ